MARKIVKPRVPRTRAGNTWTESQYWGFIRSALRKAATRYPVKYQVKADAKRTVEGKRHRSEYQCCECTKWYQDKEVQVDHVIPCGSLKGLKDLPGFVDRMFCEADGLQVMCKPCHQIKTNLETAERKKI